MECWHLGKLAAEPKGSQTCSGMGTQSPGSVCNPCPRQRVDDPASAKGAFPNSPAGEDDRKVTAHWGVDLARMSHVCPQTVTISERCLFSPLCSFLTCFWFFFFCVSWGNEVSLPCSWSPGANSGISRTEPHPTYYFISVQRNCDFFF